MAGNDSPHLRSAFAIICSAATTTIQITAPWIAAYAASPGQYQLAIGAEQKVRLRQRDECGCV